MGWFFEYNALKEYTKPGGAIIAMKADPMDDLMPNCMKEYNLLHFTLIATMAVSGLALLVSLLAVLKPCGGLLVAVVSLLEFAILIFVLYIAISGMLLVGLHWEMEDIMHCQKLHNTAWWIYLGISLWTVPLACCCMMGGFAIGMALASGRELSTVVAPALDDVDYQKLPSQPEQA